MALGPIVFASMGALGTLVYLLSSERRHKKSNKFFLLYLASIFSIWISFEILESAERGSSIRIFVAPLLLFGIYGFLYFGVMLFGAASINGESLNKDEDENLGSKGNKKPDRGERINLRHVDSEGKAVVVCLKCDQKLRIPIGREFEYKCPKCGTTRLNNI
jgi:hypothetical protein